MAHLQPIPTPRAQRWRDLRLQFAPLIVFAGALLAVVSIWKDRLKAPTLTGEVAAVRAAVTSPLDGTLAAVKVSAFQKVTKGEVVAVLAPSDPRTHLAMIQSEIDLIRTRFEPSLAQQQNATDYERLRYDWLVQKAELASAQINAQRLQSEFKRARDLFGQQLMSEAMFELAQKSHEQAEAEVKEKTQLIADLEATLGRVRGPNAPESPAGTAETVLRAIEEQARKLRLVEANLGTVALVAPLDGMVSTICRHAGENVSQGEVIVVIQAMESERIVGYLRTPFAQEPQVGMRVKVRTRSTQHLESFGEITQVGAQFEPITNALALLRPGAMVDSGLPVETTVPVELRGRIRPGELVDLYLVPNTPAAP